MLIFAHHPRVVGWQCGTFRGTHVVCFLPHPISMEREIATFRVGIGTRFDKSALMITLGLISALYLRSSLISWNLRLWRCCRRRWDQFWFTYTCQELHTTCVGCCFPAQVCLLLHARRRRDVLARVQRIWYWSASSNNLSVYKSYFIWKSRKSNGLCLRRTGACTWESSLSLPPCTCVMCCSN